MSNNVYEIIFNKVNKVFVRTNIDKEINNTYDYIIDIIEGSKYKIKISVINSINYTGLAHKLEIKSLFDNRKHSFNVDENTARTQTYGNNNPFKQGKYEITVIPNKKVKEENSYLKRVINLKKDEELDFLLTIKCFEDQIMIYPVDGYSTFTIGGFDYKDDWIVGSKFTTENSEMKYALHTGIDLKGASGTKIYAIYDGIVKAYYSAGTQWGMAITIEHNCECEGIYTSNYTHVKSSLKVGDEVRRGDIIGELEDISVPHLHFGIRKGEYSNISNRGALPSEKVNVNDTKWNMDTKPVIDESGFINPNNFKYEFQGSENE
jgi:murein DD-endopeptidase MepM/ murein hydrolase activator NlpD